MVSSPVAMRNRASSSSPSRFQPSRCSGPEQTSHERLVLRWLTPVRPIRPKERGNMGDQSKSGTSQPDKKNDQG